MKPSFNALLLPLLLLAAHPTTCSAETFGGYDCTDDCQGHARGYEWAEGQQIDDVAKCEAITFHYPNQTSFAEGCEAFVEDPSRGSEEDDDGNAIPTADDYRERPDTRSRVQPDPLGSALDGYRGGIKVRPPAVTPPVKLPALSVQQVEAYGSLDATLHALIDHCGGSVPEGIKQRMMAVERSMPAAYLKGEVRQKAYTEKRLMEGRTWPDFCRTVPDKIPNGHYVKP